MIKSNNVLIGELRTDLDKLRLEHERLVRAHDQMVGRYNGLLAHVDVLRQLLLETAHLHLGWGRRRTYDNDDYRSMVEYEMDQLRIKREQRREREAEAKRKSEVVNG